MILRKSKIKINPNTPTKIETHHTSNNKIHTNWNLTHCSKSRYLKHTSIYTHYFYHYSNKLNSTTNIFWLNTTPLNISKLEMKAQNSLKFLHNVGTYKSKISSQKLITFGQHTESKFPVRTRLFVVWTACCYGWWR